MLDKYATFDALMRGIHMAQKGVLWKDSAAGFSLNALRNALILKRELISGTYQTSAYSRFVIKEPKRREILATRIRDRAVQRMVCECGLYDQITRGFVAENVACQKGKGNLYAVKLLRKIVHEHFLKYGNNGYVLQCDIKSFFPSTKHSVAKAAINKRVKDKDLASFACKVIDSFAETTLTDEYISEGMDEKKARSEAHKAVVNCTFSDREFTGIGLGSQISQLTQLALLDDMDHFIKERLHIRGYIRYMDDFLLFHESKEYLKFCLSEIKRIVESLDLRLNAKTQIHKFSQGTTFLKWRIFCTPTGKIVMKKKRSCFIRERRKIRKLKNKVDSGRITVDDVRASFQSWQSSLSRFGCFHPIRRMRRCFYKIYGERV